jgi:hypothetical protein
MSAKEAEENARALSEAIRELKEEFEKEAKAITARWENEAKEIQEIIVKPKKTGIEIPAFFLAWVPRWQLVIGETDGTARTEEFDASGEP